MNAIGMFNLHVHFCNKHGEDMVSYQGIPDICQNKKHERLLNAVEN